MWREIFSGRAGFMHAPYWAVWRHGNGQSCPSNREEHNIVLMNHSRRTMTQRIPQPLYNELLLSLAVLCADMREGTSSFLHIFLHFSVCFFKKIGSETIQKRVQLASTRF